MSDSLKTIESTDVLSGVFSAKNDEIEAQQKLVSALLNYENLATKTELTQPLKWAILNNFKEFLFKKMLVDSSKVIAEFTEKAFQYLISKDRKGRGEYIKALESLSDKDKDKLKGTKDSNGLNPFQQNR